MNKVIINNKAARNKTTALALVFALAISLLFLSACSRTQTLPAGGDEPIDEPDPADAVPETPEPKDIIRLLDELENDKQFYDGFKGYYPLSASKTMRDIIEMHGPEVFPQVHERFMESTDPDYKKALLFAMVNMDYYQSENLLVELTQDNDMDGIAIYFLGNPFYRSPDVQKEGVLVQDKESVLSALKPFFFDNTPYEFQTNLGAQTTRVGDLALSAYLGISGMSANCECMGFGLLIPDFTGEEKELLTELVSEGRSPHCNCTYNTSRHNVSNGTFVFSDNTTAHLNRYEVEINFTPNATNSCSKVLYIQTLKITDSTGAHHHPGGPGGRQANRSTGNGTSVDRAGTPRSPYYGTDDNTTNSTDNSRPGNTTGGFNPAWLWDLPGATSTPPANTPFVFEFETCAVCAAGSPNAEGPDKCACYGCITWGFNLNGDGSITPRPVGTSNAPSEEWKRAMRNWNSQSGGNMQANHCI